jgi:NAD(P)-dependent dehydrogenase (short-subunit alcohol dehydrogenase family)
VLPGCNILSPVELKGSVAVVTGAAGGIGRALAERFAGEGMRLVLADIEESELAVTARTLHDSGATVLAHRCDVSSPADLDALSDAAYSRFGAVHVLCNNAGVGGAALPIWMQTPDTWRWVLGVNLMGVIHGIRSFVPRMIASGEPGHIVNTASMAGLLSGTLISPYYASKHAVVAVSESLYFDLHMVQANIGVSVLCPGFVKTRIGESDRNRPQAGDFGPADSGQMPSKMRELIDQGTPPDRIAVQVAQAILDGRFWVLTHPEMDSSVRDRAESLLARRNPELPKLPSPSAKTVPE